MRIVFEAVCIATPNVKTSTANMRDFRRPILSPIGAARRAPKNVPALSIDTISDDCVGVIERWPSSSLLPVEKWSSHHRIAMMPLIVLQVPTSVHVPCASLAHSLPSIVSKQNASKRDEGSNHDRRCRGTCCALGLPPCCQVEHHCRGDAPSERLVVCIAQSVASVNFFPPPTYWPLLEAVSIETSGVVEFEGIRFDFATKGLIELTVGRRRVLSSRRVLGVAVL